MGRKFEAYRELLASFEAEGRLRKIPEGITEGVIDFCSNDYMGLGATAYGATAYGGTASCGHTLRPTRPQDAVATYRTVGSSSSSRLLCGRQNEYKDFEDCLSALYGKDTLLFNSGYHANTGAVSALASLPGTVIISDKLVHASIIDGIRLSKAPFQRFRHNDLKHLRRLLEDNREADRILLMTESVFSMDGDEAPLRELVELKEEYPNVILYVDEAHAFGVRGERGLGLCEEAGVIDEIDVLVGTFGKAAASMGAFVATSPLLKQYLLNTARSFIFSTALPPSVIAEAHSNVLRLTAMQSEREYLAKLSRRLRDALREMGAEMPSTSQIVPWIVNDARKASEYAKRLRDKGFNVLPIRKPTVPAGTERLRFSVCASMTEADIDRLIDAIREIKSADAEEKNVDAKEVTGKEETDAH